MKKSIRIMPFQRIRYESLLLPPGLPVLTFEVVRYEIGHYFFLNISVSPHISPSFTIIQLRLSPEVRDFERIKHLCLFNWFFRLQTKTLWNLFSMRTQILPPLCQIDDAGWQLLFIHLFDVPNSVSLVQLMKSELQIVLLPTFYNFLWLHVLVDRLLPLVIRLDWSFTAIVAARTLSPGRRVDQIFMSSRFVFNPHVFCVFVQRYLVVLVEDRFLDW